MTCVLAHPHFGPCEGYTRDVCNVAAYIPVTQEVISEAEASRAALDHYRRELR